MEDFKEYIEFRKYIENLETIIIISVFLNIWFIVLLFAIYEKKYN